MAFAAEGHTSSLHNFLPSFSSQSTEWAVGAAVADSDDEDGEQRAAESFTARERRLYEGAEALNAEAILGDVDVEVVALNSEWSGEPGSDDDSPCAGDRHATEVFEARERRLSERAEELGKACVLGDTDVPVFTEDTEWSATADTDLSRQDTDGPGQLDQHALEMFQERERRLESRAEELEKDAIIGDTDVPVFTESKEWSEVADTDLDEGPGQHTQHATDIFQERERRLNCRAEELEKDLVIGDIDVPVFTESKEWSEVADTDLDEGPGQLDQHASAMFEEREKMLSTRTEELEKEAFIGDIDVPVIAEGQEWAGEEADEDDAAEQQERHASEMYEAREKRLTRGVDELEEAMLGDADVEVIVQNAEWAGGAAVDDEDDKFEQHAAEVYEARERNLTAREVNEELVMGDVDVPVLAESKEWAGDADDDEEDAGDPDRHATEVFEVREKRLCENAEQLGKEVVLGDADVQVLKEATEWAGGVDSEDDGSPVKMDSHASEIYKARERRLSKGAEELEKEVMVGDVDVEVLPESKEWAGEVSDNEDAEQQAAEAFEHRERRLSAGAEVLEAAANQDRAPTGDPAEADTPSASAAIGDPVLGDTASVGAVAASASASGSADFHPPSRASPSVPEEQVAPQPPADEEEESEYETESEPDEEIFKKANPDRGLRQTAETKEPWRLMFDWMTATIAECLQAEGPEVKRLKALLPAEGLDASTLKPEALCDGKILCAFIVALRPDSIGKPIPNAMGRLAQVQKACKQLGVRDNDVFAPPDIMTPPPQNPNAVLRCLTSVAGIVQAVPGYSGPHLDKGH